MSVLSPASLSIVIPALNEAGNIGRLVEETFAFVPDEYIAEVIVVDDGSADATAAEVRELMATHPELRLVRHLARAGQSAAARTGVRFATGDLVATMDGDGQNDPADILRLAALLEREGPGTALAGGIRRDRKAEGSKRLASRFANWLRGKLLADGCPDTGCGIKVFRRQVYLDLPFFCGQHRYLPALFQTYGHRVAYLAVNDRPRQRGTSKYTNLGRALIGIYDLIGVRWLMHRARTPAVVAEPSFTQRTTAIARPASVLLAVSPTAGPRLHAINSAMNEDVSWPRASTTGGQPSPRAI